MLPLGISMFHPKSVHSLTHGFPYFKGTFCNWANQNGQDYSELLWSLNVKPNTTTHKIKPEGALDTKRFIYLEDFGNTLPKGAKRRITSKTIAAPTERGYCLSFYYHMFGSYIGNLTVFIINEKTKTELSAFFRDGSQADKWLPASISMNLASLNYDFQIAFEATYDMDVSGIIAIDEIKLSTSCPTTKYCDFESGLCGWSNDKVDKSQNVTFEWTRAKGVTASKNTGPSTDHTTLSQLGYYMYIEASSPQKPGDKARFLSPVYSATGGACFKFWYVGLLYVF